MSFGNWKPTVVVQGLLWILYGLLLQPEPGTGGSEGRGLKPGLLVQYIAALLCPALYRVRLDSQAQVSRKLQSGNTDVPSPIGSGQGLGEETEAKRAKFRKTSWRRGKKSRTGRRILLGGEAVKDILGRE